MPIFSACVITLLKGLLTPYVSKTLTQVMPAPACLQPAWSTKRCGLPVQRQIFRPFGRTCRSECRQSHRSYKAHQCKASTEAQTDDRPELQIEGLEQNYCDDFVCTSSPAVEQNLRALARDVVRTSTWTADLFADEVRYKVSTKSASKTMTPSVVVHYIQFTLCVTGQI